MKVEQSHIGTVEVCKPLGPLVDDDGAQFCKLLLDRLRTQNSRIVVALSEVPYMDSPALEGFLDAADHLATRGARLKLAQTPAACREIFQITGVLNRFSFFNDVQDAVRSFL